MKTLALIVVSGIAASAANAQLLYPSSVSDTVLTPNTGNIDDNTYTPAGAAAFNLTGFTLFGAAVTPANFRVNNNGWVTFGGASNPYSTNSYTNFAMPFTSTNAGTAMIAPLWDDLYLTGASTALTGKSIRVSTPAAGTYVVTWQGEEAFQNTTPDLTFQLIMYGAGNAAGAIPGTITFAYGTMVPGTYAFNPTIGLNAGNGVGTAFIPSIGGGTTSDTAILALAATQHSFIPDANGGYTYQAGSVPTPAAAALLGLGGLMAARRRRA